jgi:hypothetical protein
MDDLAAPNSVNGSILDVALDNNTDLPEDARNASRRDFTGRIGISWEYRRNRDGSRERGIDTAQLRR